ncbi:pyridoxamine 5'-phosphate oxidase family protein [Sphingomonas faeni]|uniref:pyridoxamine 5'-phosphate oxidase family protein n=1 Tax=Sphingomonas faeni TaxID=185950 RepID=UPI0020C7AE70|nr:pyridoxamine 5'-phosphate oxidase family protein [Sphingomonas faeni]MCP8892853.1 pyridoxamine 5'-phosphate oxidase family protein [Sphingomonas faeni]
MSNATDTPKEPRNDEVAKIAELIADAHVCMFTTNSEGRLMSRPMAVQKVEFDGDLWFFTKRGGRKVEQIGLEPRVNAAFSSKSSWVSVTGKAEVVHDVQKAKQLWNAGIEAWFPNGPEDPEIVLLKVHADGAEYWDTPGAGVASILSFVKAKVTGKPYRIEDEKVDL